MGLFDKITEKYNCDICGKSNIKILMQILSDGRICQECFNKLGDNKYGHTFSIEEARQKTLLTEKLNNHPEFIIAIENAKRLKTDLLEANFPTPTDAKTAMYRGRIFSISGKNKYFPKLPDDILDTDIELYPFMWKISQPLYCKSGTEIKFSNRPFVDDRSSEEIAEYTKKQQAEIESEKNRKDYKWICKHLSDISPKSLSGYTRMRNSNSKNYQKLVIAAKEKGYII